MSSYYTPLNNEALLHIEGPDSLKFLQGQTTCDTRKVDEAKALPGAYCTVKGRVVCDFLLTEIADQHYVLRMRRDILTTSLTTLAKYIIFSKAQLDAEREDWQTFACWGPEAKKVMTTVLGGAPEAHYGRASGDGYVVVQMDESGCQFECYINTQTHPTLVTALADSFLPGESQDWQVHQIELGIARMEAATVEEFIPQMLNYDLSGHISFDKGCYTGQEVVARLHYRGTPKRRLYRAILPNTETAAAGDLLYSAGSSQSSGTVVNSATATGACSALVVATVTKAEQGFHLRTETGPLLHCTAVKQEDVSDADT
ncbi:MAG: folate-binding protein YgfZ [Halioglobus sp.]